MAKTGFGGGCHWCTEAVFQSLKGVVEVEQGYIASDGEYSAFSEGIIVTYDPEIIPLETLIEIHLLTHKSTSSHSFREKYRSAVYFLNPKDAEKSEEAISKLQKDFKKKIITQILPYKNFKASRDSLQDYYLKNPEKPFCKKYIHPKLQLLQREFSNDFTGNKL
ncbi:peptide-methionine (S)-S-oxide reductase [Salinimicrobium marinum]|nr:peptide-methionine (S)-S-oxide reductase [Salinimicrobium marinum]